MGCAHLHMQDQVFKARTVAFDLVYDCPAELVTLFRRPWTVGQLRGTILDKV